MATYTTESVLDAHHWSKQLFSFSTTRSSGLRFDNGQFVMVGLELDDGRKLVRAYSIASANHEEHLEFYSIKVRGGPLTSRLQFIKSGSPILVSSKPTGTLVIRDLNAGKRLFMLATGTGIAPFLAIAKDPQTYEQFAEVYLIRCAGTIDGLAYGDAVLGRLRTDSYLGELVEAQFRDYPTVTREPFRNTGRITTLIENGALFERLSIPPLSTATDRFMVCGNMRMIADVGRLLEARGFAGSARSGERGDFVIERAFVESFDVAKTDLITA